MYLYGLCPSLYFRHLKITYCINSPSSCSVYPFGLTNRQRACSQFFWRDRRLSSAHKALRANFLTLTRIGAWWRRRIQYGSFWPWRLELERHVARTNNGILREKVIPLVFVSGTYPWRLVEENSPDNITMVSWVDTRDPFTASRTEPAHSSVFARLLK